MTAPLPSIGRTKEEQFGLMVVNELVIVPPSKGGLGWLFREWPKMDFGIDGQIELVDPADASGQEHATGKLLSVQVKCGKSYFERDTGAGWSFYVAKSTMEYWRSHSLPVIFVIVDPDLRTAYWVRGDRLDWEEKDQSFLVVVPKNRRLGVASRAELEALAENTSAPERAVSLLENDAPLISAAVKGTELLIVLDEWYNKSSGRMDFWIGIPGKNPNDFGPRDIVPFSSGSAIGARGDPIYAASHLVPWADAVVHDDSEFALEESLYDEYLSETGAWDSEDKVYIDVLDEYPEWLEQRRLRSAEGPIGEDLSGEVTRYRLQLVPKPLASAYLELRQFLHAYGAPSIPDWVAQASGSVDKGAG